MATRRFSVVAFLVLSLILILLTPGCASSFNQEEQLKTVTLQAQEVVQAELDSLDSDLSVVATGFARIGLGGLEAREMLNGLVSNHPFVIDSCTADVAGKMVTVAPETYSSYEGSDISTQTATIKLRETKQPVLSQVFQTVEDIDAVVLMWPILSEQDKFIGSVSTLFKPEMLFTAAVKPLIKGTDININVMQPDGLTIYDSQGADIGKNLLTDPAFQSYKELIELGSRIAANESGSGSYTYINHASGKPVKKQAFWVSVGLHGTMWRLVSIQELVGQ